MAVRMLLYFQVGNIKTIFKLYLVRERRLALIVLRVFLLLSLKVHGGQKMPTLKIENEIFHGLSSNYPEKLLKLFSGTMSSIQDKKV